MFTDHMLRFLYIVINFFGRLTRNSKLVDEWIEIRLLDTGVIASIKLVEVFVKSISVELSFLDAQAGMHLDGENRSSHGHAGEELHCFF